MPSLPLSRVPRLLASVLTSPGRGLAAVVESGSVMPALLFATFAALAQTAVVVPSLDIEALMEQGPGSGAGMSEEHEGGRSQTPHEREEAIASKKKLTAVAGFAGALLGPAALALGIAALMWLGFKVAGTQPRFLASLAVTSYALIPLGVAKLLSLPALLVQRAPLRPEMLPRLFPSHLGVLLPEGSRGPLAGVLGSLDLFALWSVVLLTIGMTIAASTSRWRAAAVVVLLWLSQIAIFGVALA